MSSTGLALVYGTDNIVEWTAEDYNERIEILQRHGVKILDTATLYVTLPCWPNG